MSKPRTASPSWTRLHPARIRKAALAVTLGACLWLVAATVGARQDRATTAGAAGARGGGGPSADLAWATFLPHLALERPAPALTETVVPAGHLTAVAYAARRAYVVFQDQLHVLDLTDPARPRTLAVVPAPPGTYELAATGTRLYALAPELLVVLDVADPARPVVLGSTPVAPQQDHGGLPNIALYRQYVLVADNCRPLKVLDPTDPRAIRLVGEADQVGASPAVVKDRVVLDYGHCHRGEQGGYAAVSLADPAHPRRVGSVPWSGRPVDVAGGPFVAVVDRRSDGYSQVGLFEALPDGGFKDSAWVQLPPGATGAVADERGYVYVTHTDGEDSHTDVARVTAGAPGTPPTWTRVGRTETPAWRPIGAGEGVLAAQVVSGGILGGLDVADPARPLPGGSVTLVELSSAGLAAVDGERAYVLDGGPLVVLMPGGDPASRRLGMLAGQRWGGPTDMAVTGSFLYILNRRWSPDQESLWAVDVADPAHPRVTHELPGLVGCDLATDGRWLVVASCFSVVSSDGLSVLSLADPAQPAETGRLDGDIWSMAFAGDLLVTGALCAEPRSATCLGTARIGPDGSVTLQGTVQVQLNARPTLGLVAAVGQRAYLLQRLDDQRALLATVDLGEPVHPRVLRRQELAIAKPERLAALADGRLVASGGEVAVIALDAQGAASVVQRVAVTGPADVAGSTVAVAGRDRGLWWLQTVGPPR